MKKEFVRIERVIKNHATLFVGKHYLIITQQDENTYSIMFQKGDKLITYDAGEYDRPHIVVRKEK